MDDFKKQDYSVVSLKGISIIPSNNYTQNRTTEQDLKNEVLMLLHTILIANNIAGVNTTNIFSWMWDEKRLRESYFSFTVLNWTHSILHCIKLVVLVERETYFKSSSKPPVGEERRILKYRLKFIPYHVILTQLSSGI